MTDNPKSRRDPGGDPLRFLARLIRKLNSDWVRTTYPFAAAGRRVSIAPSCELGRHSAQYMARGDDVLRGSDVWLNIVEGLGTVQPKLVLGNRCKIGRRSVISAKNRIELEGDVLLAPGVLIMDHNHEYSDPNLPIHSQCQTEGGQIIIGRNSWLGYGCVIFCGRGELHLGRNSVVGANSVVTRSFPDFSVIAGNPAKLIKSYDPTSGHWRRAIEKQIESGSIRPV